MADDSARQYLTFTLCGERFALPSLLVSEVLDLPRLTWVPLAPDHLRGVVNLRGNAATVVDLGRKLELDPGTRPPTCLIIVERDYDGDMLPIAALADAVHEVVEIAEADIAPPPDMGLAVPTRFVRGLVRLDDTFTIVLDAEQLFSLAELSADDA
ncbi:chemotaxis protein CheW [Desulfovibrio aerotolerans]|uniref:Chemotaxis protein CheW n=1 Tax=Solidesulfovibrio aerotolerans TaxID=295255 RepID=A0A7C9IW13_9BACT|nr:chemotaxis protein CheW [Solidesulfovibrio aerotolerans]MYL83222.1 chemotaxis protein CheW [Solidesulfovibrio aerotolerans]